MPSYLASDRRCEKSFRLPHVGGDKALPGIQEILKTERNRFLNKNQTTEELERFRYDSTNIKDLINAIIKVKGK
ncbi:hypothetical protein [Leptospira alexanderi]|uniref:hypothetical protein n=1 Tax=Leptospira alexanderi TaxID=100053 RepID=UPI000991339E|nr:hypothetical protein [Leptospira alexanderi]